MDKFTKTLLIIFSAINSAFADEYKYILNDSCINKLYKPASVYFQESEIVVLRIPQGIILRFELPNPAEEYKHLSQNTLNKVIVIKKFLAKIKNTAIIEVHAGEFCKEEVKGLKNWEISTVIANNIESVIVQTGENLNQNRIKSVGYGEFLPPKNTPYNGGKFTNRVDIIILCNTIGE